GPVIKSTATPTVGAVEMRSPQTRTDKLARSRPTKAWEGFGDCTRRLRRGIGKGSRILLPGSSKSPPRPSGPGSVGRSGRLAPGAGGSGLSWVGGGGPGRGRTEVWD